MIDIRRLHASEFDILGGIDDGFTPDPEKSIAMVASRGSKIIGRLFVLAPAHLEGIHIEPEYRGGSLFKDMITAIELEAKSEGLSKLFAYSVRPEISHYLQKRCDYSVLPWTILSRGL
jgi:hypothetical protein